jgi:hypothetical protein
LGEGEDSGANRRDHAVDDTSTHWTGLGPMGFLAGCSPNPDLWIHLFPGWSTKQEIQLNQQNGGGEFTTFRTITAKFTKSRILGWPI